MTLQQLIEEENDLRDKLAVNFAAQKEIKTAEFLKKHGLKFGDTIEFKNGGKVVSGIFSSVDYIGTRPWRVFVLLFNKNGSIGKKEASCSDITNIKIIKSA